jgi:succinyl-diaminopimelate desuccinylase
LRRKIITKDLILREIEENKEEYIKFLVELIQTDSYNPPGNEKNVAVKIEKYLNDAGVETKLFPFGDNRANLVASLNNNFNGKNLLYNGHMDVVPPGSLEDWKYPPLSGTIKRKKFIYGRGATDMKSGTAAIVVALKILKKLNIKVNGNLIVNAVADEETGGERGTKWSIENVLKPYNIDLTIIAEPSRLNPLPIAIMVGEKGRLVLKVTAYGVSTHASMPFMGINPIYVMSKIIEKLNKLENYIPKVKPPLSIDKLKEMVAESFPSFEIFERIYNEQPLLQNAMRALTEFTKSLTIINGGIKDNVVPDKCEAFIDFRLLPGQKASVIINALKNIIENDLKITVKTDDSKQLKEPYVNIEISQFSEPSYWKDWESSKTLQKFKTIADNIYGKKSFFIMYTASADAHYLRNSGFCPQTVLFGPGVGTTAHSVNEYVEIEDYLNAIKVYTLFAYDFLK